MPTTSVPQMHSRPQRIGDQIREELSDLLRREVKDPGIGFTTITWVKVSADLQNARVYYTVLGDAQARKNAARALERALPFLRRHIAGRLRLRRAPEFSFQYDESVERGERIERLIEQIHATAPEPGGDGSPDRERSE
jgi:ribosome-binding factor A